jgi:histidyl-tRNA synthetase
LIGSDKPEADAEIVLLTNFLMTNLGLKYYAFKIGSIGVIRGILNADGIDEKTQNNVLQLMDKKDLDSALKLVDSEKCRTTLKGLINIKGENWQETIEKMKSYLEYYDEAKIAVENLHLTLNLITESTNIKLTLEPAFARGLEYYTGMIFEVYIPQLDIALGGGGRYDRLIETFGGEPTPAVGCAHGIDRVALALQIQGTTFELTTEKRVVVIPITDAEIIWCCCRV